MHKNNLFPEPTFAGRKLCVGQQRQTAS